MLVETVEKAKFHIFILILYIYLYCSGYVISGLCFFSCYNHDPVPSDDSAVHP